MWKFERHVGLGTGVYFPDYYNFPSERFPFVQVGFAFVPGFHSDWGFGFNARVGATYWASHHVGLRIEYLENIHACLVENSRLVVAGITLRQPRAVGLVGLVGSVTVQAVLALGGQLKSRH